MNNLHLHVAKSALCRWVFCDRVSQNGSTRMDCGACEFAHVMLSLQDVMLSLQEIALLCTQDNPADRPLMRDVENMLNTLSQMTKVMDGDGVVKEDQVGIKSSNGREEGWNENGHRNQMSWNIDVNSQGQDWSENEVGSISSSYSGNPICVISQ